MVTVAAKRGFVLECLSLLDDEELICPVVMKRQHNDLQVLKQSVSFDHVHVANAHVHFRFVHMT